MLTLTHPIYIWLTDNFWYEAFYYWKMSLGVGLLIELNGNCHFSQLLGSRFIYWWLWCVNIFKINPIRLSMFIYEDAITLSLACCHDYCEYFMTVSKMKSPDFKWTKIIAVTVPWRHLNKLKSRFAQFEVTRGLVLLLFHINCDVWFSVCGVCFYLYFSDGAAMVWWSLDNDHDKPEKLSRTSPSKPIVHILNSLN